jgi:hypothetical protein
LGHILGDFFANSSGHPTNNGHFREPFITHVDVE